MCRSTLLAMAARGSVAILGVLPSASCNSYREDAGELKPGSGGNAGSDQDSRSPLRGLLGDAGSTGKAGRSAMSAAAAGNTAAANASAGARGPAPNARSDGGVATPHDDDVDAGSDPQGTGTPNGTNTPAPTNDPQRSANAARSPDPRFFVPPTGPCPEFNPGYVTFTPDGQEMRVLLYMSDAARTLDGPLIFSFRSTSTGPEDSPAWIGDEAIDEIKAQGGIIAAPSFTRARPRSVSNIGTAGMDDGQRLLDEVVACAIQQVGIDVRRIHATGIGAGAMTAARLSLLRSGYMASLVVFSGGLLPNEMPSDQDPNNLFAAMLMWGGPSDYSARDSLDNAATTAAYRELLRAQNRFVLRCNHGAGHTVPDGSQSSAWRFMQDHPFGTTPSPYATQLPSGFARYCTPN